MTEQHPITPPPELVYEWAGNWAQLGEPTRLPEFIATRAAQWGADQELEACCTELRRMDWNVEADHIGVRRRPKPPSLKQQALETLKYPKDLWSEAEVDTIRRALEAMPDE